MHKAILCLLFNVFFICTILGKEHTPNIQCSFPANVRHDAAYKILDKLQGKRYTVKDEQYTFMFGICVPAEKTPTSGYENAGIIQAKSTTDMHVIGNYTLADFVLGNGWLMLKYEGGQSYHTACNGSRSGIIMVNCLKGETQGKAAYLEEQTNRDSGCYYLFELSHDAVCVEQPHSLSVGSILCIVFLSLVAVYLLVGFIVQRVRGAQGREQFPNYSCWKSVGNYAADGCNIVFRSSDSEARQYRGVSVENMEQEIPRSEPDDHLLSM